MMPRTTIRIIFVLKSKSLRVLDFGGAAGTHYFITSSLLDDGVSTDWGIVEPTAMANAAMRKSLNNNQLTFYDTMN